MHTEETLKEQIYTQMNGAYIPEAIPEQIKDIVQDEFANGLPCDQAYARIYNAKLRLNERLGTDEDPDIECIINSMFDICRQFSMKMFDYAKTFE